MERAKLYLVHCWNWYRELREPVVKRDMIDSFQSSDHQDLSSANSSTSARAVKKSTVTTKSTAPLSQPRHRHSPITKQTYKKTNNASKAIPIQASTAEESEVDLDFKKGPPLTESKRERSFNTIEDSWHETTPNLPTEDHSTTTHLVENLEIKDSSAFSPEKTNAVPKANTVDLAEAEDDFITAEKRKRRRTRGGAKAQRQKMAQLEQSPPSPDSVPIKKAVKKGTDEQQHASLLLKSSSSRDGNEKNTHRYTHHNSPQTPEPNRSAAPKYSPSPKLRTISFEDTRHDDSHTTPKSSPRISNTNATYANVAANTTSSSPVTEETPSPVAFSPQPQVSPSHSSMVSNNDKRQSWYSPFSSGLELDIVPRPQSSLSSESVRFKRRPSSMAFDIGAGNYQHPDVLNALFRGGEGDYPAHENVLGLTPKLDNNEMRRIVPETLAPAPYNRWELFDSNTKAPIGPPSAASGRPLSVAGFKVKPEWDNVLTSQEMEPRQSRQSWGVIGNNEPEGWSTQPEPIRLERKKSNSGFSFFDRRLSSFSPRR